jgi:DNA uptake protein ComE-like DNA-binding protein
MAPASPAQEKFSMNHNIDKIALIALVFLFTTSACSANVPPPGTAAKPAANHHTSEPAKGSKAKAAPIKLVDINSASKAELKTLSGIDDALAEKIIKGRPYLSKAFLVTNNILPRTIYDMNKQRIIARQK